MSTYGGTKVWGRGRQGDPPKGTSRVVGPPRTFSKPSLLRQSFQLFMKSPGNLSLLKTPMRFPPLLAFKASIIFSKLALLLSF